MIPWWNLILEHQCCFIVPFYTVYSGKAIAVFDHIWAGTKTSIDWTTTLYRYISFGQWSFNMIASSNKHRNEKWASRKSFRNPRVSAHPASKEPSHGSLPRRVWKEAGTPKLQGLTFNQSQRSRLRQYFIVFQKEHNVWLVWRIKRALHPSILFLWLYSIV